MEELEKNYYEILEISENASQEIVEKAYKTLALKYHPDLQQSSEAKAEFEEKLKLINEAYDVLRDANKRTKYDELLSSVRAQAEAAAASTRQHSNWDKVENSNKQQNSWDPDKTNNSPSSSTWNGTNQANNFAAAEEAIKQEVLRQQALNQEALRQEAIRQEEAINRAYQKAYNDAYIQELKRRGFKIKYQKSPKDYLRIAITFCVVILVIVVLWQIPFIRKYFVDLYNNNDVVHMLVSPFIK